jgi:beta-N-acetylhexosaminidase
VPLIDRGRAELDACELLPFRAAIAAGVRAVMTGHLLVPAYDDRLPATLSRAVLTGLLREDLGFDGLIVTDGIEMQGVRRQYGLAGATVRALAAGADAICVGGEHADEHTAVQLRDAIVAAVRGGNLPADRLYEAATRVRRLAGWVTGHPSRTGPRTAAGAGAMGLAAARRAVRVTGAGLPVAGPAHVVEFAGVLNIAIGAETPWGVGAPLDGLLPGTTSVRLTADDLEGLADPAARVLAGAAGRPLVLVVRDVHRYPWLAGVLARVLDARPEAVVVEMGVPMTVLGGVHIATYGATRACGLAAAELIAGTRVPEPLAA